MLWVPDDEKTVSVKLLQPDKVLTKCCLKYSKLSEEISFDYLLGDNARAINENSVDLFILKKEGWGESGIEILSTVHSDEARDDEVKPKYIQHKSNPLVRYFSKCAEDEEAISVIKNLSSTTTSNIITINIQDNNYDQEKNSDEENSFLGNDLNYLLTKKKRRSELKSTNIPSKINATRCSKSPKGMLSEKLKKYKSLSKILKKRKIHNKEIFSLDFIPFNTVSKGSIIIRCKYCHQSDHLSIVCQNIKESAENLCIYCLGLEHKLSECPNRKCLRCNEMGHSFKQCNASRKILKCTICRNVNHKKNECLFNPESINPQIMKSSICYFCGLQGHFICPIQKERINATELSDSEISASDNSDCTETYREKDKNKKKREIKETTCPKCAGYHKLEKCNNNVHISQGEYIRQGFSKMFFSTIPSKLAQDKNFVNDSFSD